MQMTASVAKATFPLLILFGIPVKSTVAVAVPPCPCRMEQKAEWVVIVAQSIIIERAVERERERESRKPL